MSWCGKDQVKPEVEVRHLLGNIDTNRLGCTETVGRVFLGTFDRNSGRCRKVEGRCGMIERKCRLKCGCFGNIERVRDCRVK